MSKDSLLNIFESRESFMHLINDYFNDEYPSWPIDLSDKESQKVCREIALKGVEEMFEALGHLKNWKPHRSSDMPDIDQEEFLEEIVDAFNYFLTLLVLCGVDNDRFFKAFLNKHEIIKKRLDSGY